MPQKLEDLFSQEELDGMSDEERADFETELAADVDNDDDEPGDKDNADVDTDDPDKDDDTDDPGDDPDDEATADDPDKDKDTDPDAKDPTDADKKQPTEPKQREPAQQEPPGKPDDAEGEAGDSAPQDPDAEKKAELQGKLKALREQFEEGEITFEDYLDQRDEAKDQLREMATEARVQDAIRKDKEVAFKEQVEAQWRRDQQTFFGEEKTLDSQSDDFDEDLYKTFRQQAQVKLSDPSYANVGGVDLLKEAAREARAIKGVAAPADDDKKKGSAAEARQKANKSGKDKAPKTLADAPNDAEQDVSANNKFGYIDRLIDQGKTREAEKAIEKLSAEDQERYLRS